MSRLILTLLISILFYMPATAQVFDLSSHKKEAVECSQSAPKVYKPSKMVVGTKSKFIIKAEPGSHIALLTSNKNAGAKQIYGKTLRLGPVINAFEGTTAENGVLELDVPLPEEEELVGKILYFEVIAGEGEDFDNMQVANIMGIDGRETDVNAVIIAPAPKNIKLPGFGATIPGTNMNINRAMDAINSNSKYNDENAQNCAAEQSNYRNGPLMLRNLRLQDNETEN